MTDDDSYPRPDFFPDHPDREVTNQTHDDLNQSPSEHWGPAAKHPDVALKDYHCPFCGHKLFRGKVHDFKMVCHECNRLVDSSKLEGPSDIQES